ncbi:MAG: phosphoribosylanthranilate isomerase [Pseudomonadota bacterium]
MENRSRPQIKICGLKHVEEALFCADLGVHAIGCVFYPKSPRHLSDAEAGKICRAVSGRVQTVGVFVNESVHTILQKVRDCGLTAVQLHGKESPDTVNELRRNSITVIKTLFVDGTPNLTDAALYNASAFLVECGKGPLPGGNAMAWDWRQARDFGDRYPLLLAGGLSPENISQAILEAFPAAVDVSSGVESAPGQKNLKKIEAFVRAVYAFPQTIDGERPNAEIFRP